MKQLPWGHIVGFYLGMFLAIYGGYRLGGIWGAIVVWRLHPYLTIRSRKDD